MFFKQNLQLQVYFLIFFYLFDKTCHEKARSFKTELSVELATTILTHFVEYFLICNLRCLFNIFYLSDKTCIEDSSFKAVLSIEFGTTILPCVVELHTMSFTHTSCCRVCTYIVSPSFHTRHVAEFSHASCW